MHFMRLWPLGLLIIIPILILLYMLKKQNVPKIVPSTFLWQEILDRTYADKPWQKLKNHILLVLQCLAILFLVLALMGPVMPWGGHYYKNVIFVVDTSASMNAQYDTETRLEKAKDWMSQYITKAKGKTQAYIITADKKQLKDIRSIEPSYNTGQLSEAIEMAKTIGSSLNEGYEIVVLTDKEETEEKGIHYVYFGNSGSNGAISLMSHQFTKDEMLVLMQVENTGDQVYTGDVSLYGEEQLIETKTVTLEPKEHTTLHFQLPFKKSCPYSYLKGTLEETDNLSADNNYYYVPHTVQKGKVLLVTEGNIFLEKALTALKDCEIYKTNDLTMLEEAGDYDLYIVDRKNISKLPKQGNLLLIGCEDGFEEKQLDTSCKIEGEAKNLPDYLKSLTFSVNSCKTYQVPDWAESLLKTKDGSVAFIGEKEGQKIGVLGFDLWDSDFVLKTDFPLLMYYLGEQLWDTSILSKNNFISNESIQFVKSQVEVTAPTGTTKTIEDDAIPISKQLGIYKLAFEKEGEKETVLIAVNYPVASESDLSQKQVGETVPQGTSKSLKSMKELTPYMIMILLGVVLAEWYFYRKGIVLKAGVICSRILICFLLIGALCHINILLPGKNAATVFLLDVSDSMTEFREEGIKFIQDALKNMPKNHKAAVIVFGKDSQIDKFLDESKHYDQMNTAIIRTSTNIEEALQKGAQYLPETASKEMILLTDGQENQGDMLQAANTLKDLNVDFKVYQVTHQKKPEVYIKQVSMPDKIYKNEKFSVVVKVESNVKTKGKLSLFSGQTKTEEQEVALETGENIFIFKDIQKEGGFKSYRAVITSADDETMENNEYTTFTNVQDTPNILVIEGKEGAGKGILAVLQNMGGTYQTVQPNSAPDTLKNMMVYKTIVLCNVFEADLPKGFLDNIEPYVKNYGGGVIVTGGEDAYAPGGYQGTVLEKILPVNMNKKGQINMADCSLSLVIDHSASMENVQEEGSTKLQLSLQAASYVIDYLKATDEISVYSFDDQYTEVIKPQKVEDKEAIKDKVYGITIGGGTSIYPALEAAYKTQQKSKASIKHIILLTDGEDENDAYQYTQLLQEMKQDNITLSTISVGDETNQSLLQYLAQTTGGESYTANNKTNLPKLFIKDYIMSTGEYLINETFTPQIVNTHEILKSNLENSDFTLNGYVGTSMKPLGTELLTSAHSEPILAVWQYGLGKTAAWTSDVNGEWSAPLFKEHKGQQLFKNLLAWTMTDYEGAGKVTITEDKEGVKINFKASETNEDRAVKVTYQDAAGKEQELELPEISPGIYEKYISLDEKGFYVFNVIETNKDNIAASYIQGFAKQYSKEYQIDQETDRLIKLIETLDGKLITMPNQVFHLKNKRGYKKIDLTNAFLLIALMAFIIDILCRHFRVNLLQALHIQQLLHAISPKIPHKPSKISTPIVNTQEPKVQEIHNSQTTNQKPKKEKPQKAILDTNALLKAKKDRNES